MSFCFHTTFQITWCTSNLIRLLKEKDEVFEIQNNSKSPHLSGICRVVLLFETTKKFSSAGFLLNSTLYLLLVYCFVSLAQETGERNLWPLALSVSATLFLRGINKQRPTNNVALGARDVAFPPTKKHWWLFFAALSLLRFSMSFMALLVLFLSGRSFGTRTLMSWMVLLTFFQPLRRYIQASLMSSFRKAWLPCPGESIADYYVGSLLLGPMRILQYLWLISEQFYDVLGRADQPNASF